MLLHARQEDGALILHSSKLGRRLRIEGGRVTEETADSEIKGLQCVLIGISSFPNDGHGFIILCTQVSIVGRSPVDGYAIYRVDTAQVVPIGQPLSFANGKVADFVYDVDDPVNVTEEKVQPIDLTLQYRAASPLTDKFAQTCKSLLEGQTYFSHTVLLGDDAFHYNAHLARGLDGFAVRLVQGFVACKRLATQCGPVDVLLIGKRSRHRNGLRYQRRGLDDDGNVANFVETTQITIADSKLCIFKQLRGSVPLSWSQEPWAFRPVPVVREDTTASRKHFAKIADYGRVLSIDLTEQCGREAILGNAYRKTMHDLAEPLISFDFHKEMSSPGGYNNLSKLTNLVRDEIDWTVTYVDDVLLDDRKQTRIIRTNCVDCLDRTNVVQAALAREVLNQYGSIDDLQGFQSLWADHGDAIAQQYTGTPALKGDFVRTGKRELRGIMNDAKNALRRYYSNMIDDYYRQLVIDSLLGIADDHAVGQFESSLQTQESKIYLRVLEQRTGALQACKLILGLDCPGWVMLSPGCELLGSMSEVVILIDQLQAVLYVCTFDTFADKIVHMEPIPLAHLTRIISGVYVTSIVHKSLTDPEANFGFMITWQEVTERMLAFKAVDAKAREVVNELTSILSRSTGLAVVNQDIVGVGDHGVKGLLSLAEHRLFRYIWS